MILSLLLCLLESTIEPPQPFLEFYSSFSKSLTLLRLDEVRSELKLNDQQNAKIKTILEQLKNKYHQKLWAIPDVSSDKGTREVKELVSQTREEGRRLVSYEMTPEQIRRFDQICIQQLGVLAFKDEAVVKQLRLTEEQMKKVTDILTSSKSKKDNLRVMTANAYEKIDGEALLELVAIHTADQKKVWSELVGKELKINQFGILTRLK